MRLALVAVLCLVAACAKEPLAQDDEIIADVQQALGVEVPKLHTCYEERLAERADLKGKWKIAFTIAKEGSVKSAAVTDMGTVDEPLQACLKQRVEQWTFAPLANDLDIAKTVSFE